MRARIGNVTARRKKQAEQDPAREEMRRALVTANRMERAKIRTGLYIDELSGEKDASEAILQLFDEQGHPPPFTCNDLVRQFKKLRAQQLWLIAAHEEMEIMLKKLDPERYAQEQAERAERAEDLQERKEAVRETYGTENAQEKRPWLSRLLREALQATNWSRELERIMQRDMSGARICAAHQIEEAMQNFFIEYAKDPPSRDPERRYGIIRRESDWLAVSIADMNIILLSLNELIDSGKIYLERDND